MIVILKRVSTLEPFGDVHVSPWWTREALFNLEWVGDKDMRMAWQCGI